MAPLVFKTSGTGDPRPVGSIPATSADAAARPRGAPTGASPRRAAAGRPGRVRRRAGRGRRCRREGWRSFDIARASIWRIRSRVRLKYSPTSSRVRGSPRSRPKRRARIWRSRSSSGAEQLLDLVGQQRGGGHLERRLGRAVLDDVAELGVAVLAQRLRQRQRLGREAQRLGDLVLGHLDLGGELGERGRAAELELQARPGLLEPGERVAGVDREPDGATGVGDAAGDGLADPPGGVGGELEALAPVELLDRVHQAEVALLDEVEERQARRLVLLGDRDDQPQVRLHEGPLGVVAVPGACGAAPASWPA